MLHSAFDVILKLAEEPDVAPRESVLDPTWNTTASPACARVTSWEHAPPLTEIAALLELVVKFVLKVTLIISPSTVVVSQSALSFTLHDTFDVTIKLVVPAAAPRLRLVGVTERLHANPSWVMVTV